MLQVPSTELTVQQCFSTPIWEQEGPIYHSSNLKTVTPDLLVVTATPGAELRELVKDNGSACQGLLVGCHCGYRAYKIKQVSQETFI